VKIDWQDLPEPYEKMSELFDILKIASWEEGN